VYADAEWVSSDWPRWFPGWTGDLFYPRLAGV